MKKKIVLKDYISWQTYFKTTYIINERTKKIYTLKKEMSVFWKTMCECLDYDATINKLKKIFMVEEIDELFDSFVENLINLNLIDLVEVV